MNQSAKPVKHGPTHRQSFVKFPRFFAADGKTEIVLGDLHKAPAGTVFFIQHGDDSSKRKKVTKP